MLDAADEDEAIRALDGLGLVPVSIRQKQGINVASPQVLPSPVGIRRRHINEFVRSLANLVKGNVPLLKGLALLEKQSPSGMREVVADLAGAVREGSPLSQALDRHPGVFSRLMVAMVRGGESAGLLGEMLEKTADHEEKTEDLRRKVQGALAYPIFVLAMGGITLFVLLVYFMPRLMETYLTTGHALPWPTAVTLGTGRFLSSYWYWILGLLFLIFALVRQKGGSGKAGWDMIKLQLPLLRTLVLKNSVVGFSRTLSLLMANGVPLVKGVPLAAQTVTNLVMAGRLSAVEENLTKHGYSLATALRNVPDFPPLAVDLVVVGEESGDVASALRYVADQYEREVEVWLKALTTLLEPALILLIGGVIGFIVFAMLMPIFQMDVLTE